jgi:uracil-DNA glycosylase family 4
MNEKFYDDRYIPPSGPIGAKILLVGEAPGSDEYLEGAPFVGESGKLLINSLNRNGLSREDVRLHNLFPYRPVKNKFEPILTTPELRESLAILYSYIKEFRPNVIGALGNYPLRYLTGRKGITKWRGSIISYIHDEKIKVIPTLHPAAVLRDGGYYPTFDQDIKRIVADSLFPEKNLPVRKFIIDPRGLECEEWVQRLCAARFLGTDIETVKGSKRILCVGFAPSPDVAVCFVPDHHEGKRAIERILASDVDKIFQFGTFDTIQLEYLNGYEINPGKEARTLDRPYFWDTLIAQHNLAPELPRSLEYLTSIYTREPYYKTVGRGTIPDDEKGWSEKVEKQSLYEYNCRDCCCTIEIALEQMKEMEDEPIGNQAIFNFEMQLITDLRELSCNGFYVDLERRALLEKVHLAKWNQKQFILDRMAGAPTNVRSPKLKNLLYDQLGLPVRKNKEGGITTDEDAIVASITYCKDHIASLKTDRVLVDWKIKLAICQLILEIRGIRQNLANYIFLTIQKGKIKRLGSDGRIRSTFKSGPETGRTAASKFVDGSGFNSQTLPRDPIEIPDEILAEFNKEQEAKIAAMISEAEKDEEEDELVMEEVG